ncbi:type II secretion system F family protein [Ferviditalea candida]|uniref:Type II secretion system F family protein n=1 Tax=Ferviditalea candida TaxID=3108399 RepID=A0ABU5ZCN3_9BACL|nr:type II secretion system F family protein [Paenibacillaceae bacterium T2]
MMYVTFGISVTLFIYSIFAFRQERKERVKRRIRSFVDQEAAAEETQSDKKEHLKGLGWLRPVWRMVKRAFRKKMPGQKEERIELKLLQAGRPFNMTAIDFRLFQISLLLILPVLASGYGWLIHAGIGTMIMLAFAGIGAAALFPHYYIGQKIKQRNKLALRELPDVLDLLTVSLEAGLGFDAALSKLVSKKQGIVAAEFQRSLEEIRLGKTRREALSGVRDRLLVEEIRTLISSILQAEKLGIGMVQVFRIQSVEVREKRKQRAEEAAMKAPIKMLFPMVFFVFPTMFIVLLGPVLIQFISTFSK